jgi:hypothetical protein
VPAQARGSEIGPPILPGKWLAMTGKAQTRRERREIGPAGGCVFVLVTLGSLVVGRSGFFGDPGTFWHARLGEQIVATGSVPQSDTLTLGRSGAAWVDQSWLFDAGLGYIVIGGGWTAAAVLTALVLGATYAGLAAWLEGCGFPPRAAVAASIVAAGLGAVHFLCRPHLFTFLGVLVVLAACRAAHDGQLRALIVVPPAVALWANLHGGFLAGPVIVLTAAAGEAVSGSCDRCRLRRVRAFLLTGIASLAAGLINPYGIALYRHAYGLLFQSGVTRLVLEYQPVRFGSSDAVMVEVLLLGCLALAFCGPGPGRAGLYDLSHFAVWLGLGLSSVRHLPLFGLACAPVLGALLARSRKPDSGTEAATPPRSERPGIESHVPRPPFISLGLAALLCVLARCGLISAGPDPDHWPAGALPSLARLKPASRLFHEQDWGGLLAWERTCRVRPWIDDRFELWGLRGMSEYAGAMDGGSDWDRLDHRENFDAVWLRPGRPLAARLLNDPAWSLNYQDRMSILFVRSGAGPGNSKGFGLSAASETGP